MNGLYIICIIFGNDINNININCDSTAGSASGVVIWCMCVCSTAGTAEPWKGG